MMVILFTKRVIEAQKELGLTKCSTEELMIAIKAKANSFKPKTIH